MSDVLRFLFDGVTPEGFVLPAYEEMLTPETRIANRIELNWWLLDRLGPTS